MKLFYSWTIASPARTFAVVFAVAMLLGPGLATLSIHPLSPGALADDTVGIAGFAACCAAGVFIHRRSPWLSLYATFGILMQVVLALLILYAPIGARLGQLHPDPKSVFDTPRFFQWSAAWAALALGCAWGIIRNEWWGYFGEVLVLCAIVAAPFFFPTPPDHHPRPEVLPGQSVIMLTASCISFTMLLWHLVKRGRERWRARSCVGS